LSSIFFPHPFHLLCPEANNQNIARGLQCACCVVCAAGHPPSNSVRLCPVNRCSRSAIRPSAQHQCVRPAWAVDVCLCVWWYGDGYVAWLRGWGPTYDAGRTLDTGCIKVVTILTGRSLVPFVTLSTCRARGSCPSCPSCSTCRARGSCRSCLTYRSYWAHGPFRSDAQVIGDELSGRFVIGVIGRSLNRFDGEQMIPRLVLLGANINTDVVHQKNATRYDLHIGRSFTHFPREGERDVP
jgi:hypothetical protein